jgi:hypothetical protein
MCLVQIKQAQIKFPLSGFWTVQTPCPTTLCCHVMFLSIGMDSTQHYLHCVAM